jgi:hypothetical protein
MACVVALVMAVFRVLQHSNRSARCVLCMASGAFGVQRINPERQSTRRCALASLLL